MLGARRRGGNPGFGCKIFKGEPHEATRSPNFHQMRAMRSQGKERHKFDIFAVPMWIGLLLHMTLVVGCANDAFVESRDVVSGSAGEFSVGMTKEQVLSIARQEAVHAIKPVLYQEPSVNFSNSDSLVLPKSGHALALFDNDRVRVVYTLSQRGFLASEGADKDPLSAYSDERPHEFLLALRRLLATNHALSVREVVASANGVWFDLDAPEGKVQGTPISYDIWSFEVSHVKPAGASYVVYFANDRVVRIAYSRPRIRVE
ncbi:hypothetical protein SAMN02799615_02346 [Dyella marensis]|uniref:Uncharacterized protein n=2 Tax=Rhodanobacteraceae TaxID=1775411 RepID=A0A1I2FLY9_9GAMM|nr:hypothetical protein SAMN02799615_02346 [Dyella marensis]